MPELMLAVPRRSIVNLTHALEYHTGETWTEERVKDQFLLPVNRALSQGVSLLEAEARVWKRLGLLEEDDD